MVKKVYSINTTAGPRYAIGTFNGDELLAGSSKKYYKKLSAAQKALDDLVD